MYQRNTTNNDNRRQFVIQNHHFTYHRKGNHEVQVQALSIIVADLQNRINNLGSGSSGGNDGVIGVIWFNRLLFTLYIYMQICGSEYLYISPGLINPVPSAFFKHTPRSKT